MAEIPLTDPQCERLPLDWGRDLCTLNLVKPFVDSSDGNWRGNHGCTDTALRTKYAVISMFHPMIRGWQRIVKSPQTDVPGSYLILSVRASWQRPVAAGVAQGSAISGRVDAADHGLRFRGLACPCGLTVLRDFTNA